MKSETKSTLSEPVYDHLKNMLITLKLKPGEKIPENKLAHQMGISRTPIREALRRLANEGVVNIYPNRYAEVITFDDDCLRHMGETRLTIERMITKLAVFYGSNADFIRLSQLADSCSKAAEAGDYMLLAKTDVEFHMEFANISKNPLLIKIQNDLSFRVQLLVNWKFIGLSDFYDRSAEHKNLVEALIARDEKRALKIVTDHLVAFYSLGGCYPENFFL